VRKTLRSLALCRIPLFSLCITCVLLFGFISDLSAQSGPVFIEHSDITLSCEDPIPALGDCEATSPDCPGPVTITTFESENGAIEHHCSLTPSKLGNSVGWAFWLSLENMPVERWKFYGPAYLEQYEDGTAHLWGTIQNYNNLSYKFEVSLWFSSRRNWEEWSALGRGYRNDSGLVGNNYIDWDYYELMGEFSSFIGIDGLEGNYLNVAHYPTSKFYGFQSGIGANNKNANSGFGGAFCYTGMILGEHCGAGVGHISVDTDCDNGNAGCGGTAITKICKAVDTCGNIAYHSQTIHVVDDVAPVVDEYEEEISVLCGEHYENFISATDNCSEVIITYTDQLVIPGCGGQILRTYKVADGCGNFVNATQIIHLEGDASPEFIIFPDDAIIACNQISELNNVVITWTGPCNQIAISHVDETIAGNCAGSYTLLRTYTLTDDCGNAVSRTWTVTVEDTTPPQLVGVPANVSINCGDNIPEINVTATDNCDLSVVNVTLVATTEITDCGYNFIRTWTAVDACGNVAQASQIISLADQEPPVFTYVPADVNLACSDSGSIDDLEMAEASDDCLGLSVLFEDTPLAGNCGDGFIRTFTATDACGNSVSATQTVSFTDDVEPVFTFVPSDITIVCGESYELPNAIAEDNCSSVTITSEDDFNASCGGSFTRTYTATDGCGNTSSASVNVTFIDNEAPEVLNPPAEITVDCNSIPALEDYQIQYIDDCGSVDVDFSESIIEGTGTCAGSYTIVRQWILTDDCGNSAVAVWNINVQDNVVPQLQGVPTDMALNCGDEIAEINVTAIDNCDPNVNVTLVATTELNDCGYNFIRTWTAIDACGNVAEAVQVITLTDQEPPVFTFVPEDINLACSVGSSIDDLEIAEASDDCLGVVVLFDDAPIGGNCGDGILRTFTATDACGNTITATQTITFTDEEAPTFTFIPSDIIVTCGESYELPDAIAEDNCSSVTLTQTDAFNNSCGGSFTRTYTATDGCGNAASASVNVTIVDNEAPEVLNPPAEITVDCNSIPASEDYQIQYIDDCGAVDVDFSENIVELPGACPGSYTIIREWVLTDDCGNSSVASWIIHVHDNIAPQLQGVPTDVALNCGDEITEVNVTAIDNCDPNVNVTLVATTELNDCGYNFIRTWTAVDACGNVAEAVQVITLTDQEPPVFTFIPEDVDLVCGEGSTVDDLEIAEATDDCLGVVVLFEDTPLGGNCGDGILRTFTATDACGNTITATQTITFTDNDAPVFTFVPEDIVSECGSDIELEMPIAADNCSSVTITFDDEATGACGSFVRTYTAEDGCGNIAQAVVTVSLNDEEAPQINGIPATSELNCGDNVDDIQPTVTDNCTPSSSIVITMESSTETIDCGYILTRTWTATDACGNSSQASHVATVADNQEPMFTFVPNNLNVVCGTDYVLEDPIVEDDCSNLEVTTQIIELNTCAGSFRRVFTATDACGNVATAEQLVTITDNVDPVFLTLPENVTVSCDEIPTIESANITYTDNCSDLDFTVQEEVEEGDCPGNYTITRQMQVQDACGNRADHDWIIQVVDDTDPVFASAPSTLVLDCSAPVPAFEVLATDNCGGNITYNNSEEEITSECGYQLMRTRTATDACGNVATITQTVTVEDFAPPVFSFIPQNITIDCGDNLPEVVMPTAEDQCSGETQVTLTETILPGSSSCPSNYTLFRVFTSVDDCGNEAMHIQTITVADLTGPTFINFEPEITVNCTESNTPFVIVVDNCGTASLSYTDEVFGNACSGGIVRTYVATDNCGNETTMIQFITLIDEIAPVFLSFPEDIETSCDEIPAANTAEIEYEDNCSEVELIFTESIIEGDCPNNYTIERVWTLIDNCFNTTTQTWTIVVSDTENPTLVGVPQDLFIDCSESIPSAEVFAVDNCSSDLAVSLFATTVEEGCNQIFIRRWNAEDECGNLVQAIQNVIITDLFAPVLSEYPEDMTIPCDNTVPQPPTITAEDNCMGNVAVNFTEEVTTSPNACSIITRSWCATDCIGNEECHTQTITFVPDGGMIMDGLTAWSLNTQTAIIEVTSADNEQWGLDVFDVNGKVIAPLYQGEIKAGETRRFTFNPLTYGDAFYVVRYTNGKKVLSKKLLFAE